MRLKLVLGIFLLCSVFSQAQKLTDGVHRVYFFKSSNDGEYKEAIFQVDSVGNVIEAGNPTGLKVNLKSFTNAINAFVKNEKPEFVVPTGQFEDEEEYSDINLAQEPGDGEQVLYISVVLAKDHVAGADFSSESYYSYEYFGTAGKDTEYSIYKYLSPEDKKIIKSKLEY